MKKKLRNLFLTILLILPMMFVFSACGNNDGDSKPPTTQQPSDPGGEIPVKDTYKVIIDYALPEKLEGILTNKEITSNTDTSFNLPIFTGSNLDKYFEGWYYLSNNQKIEAASIKGTKDQTISIYATWKEDILDTYYTDGLQFETDSQNNFASVVGYLGTRNTVVIPKTYIKDNVSYEVSSISAQGNSFSSIKEVIVLGNNIDIGERTFQNSSIEKFDFSGIKTIGNFAFSGSKLFEAVFSEDLYSIGTNAFENCKEFTRVDFSKAPSNYFMISEYLFQNCEKLADVKFSEFITNIQASAFKNCLSLKNIDFIANVQAIESEAFYNCNSLSKIVLSDKLDNIGFNVFGNIYGKVDLILGKLFNSNQQRLSEIFGNSTNNIEKITLEGDSIFVIYQRYFADCVGLKSFIMADSVTEVQQYAFAGCENLLNITFSQNIVGDTFNANAFEDTMFYKQNDKLLIRNGVVLLAPHGLPEILTVEDFAGATSIAKDVFANNSSVRKVVLPKTLVSIGSNAFLGCKNLYEIEFEENSELTTIWQKAFYECENLSKLNLNNCKQLSTIANYAFYRTGNINTFILPASIEILGKACFGFANISAFEIDGENLNYLAEDGVLYELAGGKKVSIYAYPNANLSTIYKVPNTVTTIKQSAFANNSILEFVYISSEITFETEAFLNTKTTILTESENYNLPLNDDWNSRIYVKYDIGNEEYTILGETIEFNFNFDSSLTAKYFVKIVDGDKSYYYTINIVKGEAVNITDISSSIVGQV